MNVWRSCFDLTANENGLKDKIDRMIFIIITVWTETQDCFECYPLNLSFTTSPVTLVNPTDLKPGRNHVSLGLVSSVSWPHDGALVDF